MTCDNCKKENTEVAVFNKKLLGLFKIKVRICQSCISKVFKQFRKGI